MKYLLSAVLLLICAIAEATTPLSIPPIVISTGHQNDRLVTAGYLDVQAIYGADPTGNNDSTSAIQSAMNDAITYSMVAYVPSGTYKISNTLNGVQDCNNTNNYNFGAISQYGMHRAPSLVGPASGARPTIFLADNSAGFGNPASPKPLVFFINTTANPVKKTSCGGQYQNDVVGAFDILFHAVIRDINFTTGNNPGAIGIRYFSAQYSYMQNVSVNATGGLVGIEGSPATEVWTNIDVNGGRYGVVVDYGACGTASFAGLTLENQTTAGFSSNPLTTGPKAACGGLTISGFNFQESGVPAISLGQPSTHGATLDLIDGSITISSGTAPAISNPSGVGVYMNNVFAKAPSGSSLITNNAPPAGVTVISPTASGGWDHFQEYAHNDSGTYDRSFAGGVPINGYTVISDVETKNDFNSTQFVSNGAAPPSDLVTRNVPGQMPWILDPNGILDPNVKWVTDYGADTTGKSDSTTAIRAAIIASLNNGDEVFLPRGVYNITGTLTLNPNTKLFGTPGHYSSLNGSAWVTNSTFQPFIQSANTVSGTALLSDIGITLPTNDSAVKTHCQTLSGCTLFPAGFTYNAMDNTYLSAVKWEVGRKSIVNQLGIGMQFDNTPNLPSAARKFVQLDSNGGGRWFGLQIQIDGPKGDPVTNSDLRALLASGTAEPTTLYGSNPEHLGGTTFYEFSAASNIRVLGIKTEDGGNNTLLQLDNGASNILITGINGDYNAGVLTVSGASDVSLANAAYYGDPGRDNQISTASTIIDSTAHYSINNAYTLFKLGNFNDSVFALSSADTQAPSVPTHVQAASPSSGSVTVTFTASTDNVGVTGYNIYRNGSIVGTSASTSYSDTGLADGTYSYTVSAYDAAGNTSVQSTPPASITLPLQSGVNMIVSPSTASSGQTVSFTATLGITQTVPSTQVIFWVKNSAGTLITRTGTPNISFTAGVTKQVPASLTIPATMTAGTYSVTTSVYSNDGQSTYTELTPYPSGTLTIQ
jgi:hypothetical protein